MKFLLLNLILIVLCLDASAQQTAKIDDAKLLEYYQNQRYQDAANYLKENFPEPINDVKVLSRLAYTTQMANRLPEAEAYYQRVYNMDTTNQGALFSMGSINLKRGNYLRAETYYLQILAKDSVNFAVNKQLANIAGMKNDTLAEIRYLQNANKLNNQDIDVAVDLANCYIEKKAYEPAMKILKTAAESDPENVYILHSMTIIAFKQKLWVQTIQTISRLIQLGAGNDDLLYKMGVSYFSLKNYACGAEVFASIKAIAQTEYSYYYAAECYKSLKDYNMAITMLNNAIAQSISSNVASYYGELADSNEKLHRNKTAMAAYQKALQFNEDPNIYKAMAQLYETQGNKLFATKYYKLAILAYQKNLTYNDNPISYYTLGALYDEQLKDTANAIKFYRKYLDAKPSQSQQQFIQFTQGRISQLQRN